MCSAAQNVLIVGMGITLVSACGGSEVTSEVGLSGLFVAAEPGGFTFDESALVELSSSRPAEIFYSLDGTTPTEEDGIPYDGPIELSDDTLLNFIAISDDGVWSPPGSELYQVRDLGVAPELVPRLLDLERDVVFFDAEPGRRDRVERSLRLRSRGTDAVSVQRISLTANHMGVGFYEEGVFHIEGGAEPRLLPGGEHMDIRLSYSPTASFRTAMLVIESDEQRSNGVQTVELWGRVLDW